MYTANSNYILYVYKYLYGLYQPQNIQSAQLAHRKSHVYPRLLQHIIFDKNWKRKKKSSNSNQINKCFFFFFFSFFFVDTYFHFVERTQQGELTAAAASGSMAHCFASDVK